MFLKLLTGDPSSPAIVVDRALSGDALLELVRKDGLAVIPGDLRRLRGMLLESGIAQRRFAIMSGNLCEVRIALPLDSRAVCAAALRQLLLYKGRKFSRRFAIRLLMFLNFPPLYPVLFSKRFSVVADPRATHLFSFLELKYGKGMTCSFYAGSRKFILPLFKESGDLIGYARAYFPGKESEAYGENEVAVLRRLKTAALGDFSVPEVLSSGHIGGFLVVVLSTIGGARNMNGITPLHMRWLKTLSSATGNGSTLERSEFSRHFEEEMLFLRSDIPDAVRTFEPLHERAFAYLKEKRFTYSLVMREFPFSQMLKTPHGFFVLDWEQARFGFPPIFDLFSLIVSTGRFRRGDYVELYKNNIKDLFFRKNRRVRDLLTTASAWWGLDAEDAYHFFILFLLDQLYIHLHVGHRPSADRVIALLKELSHNEKWFSRSWVMR